MPQITVITDDNISRYSFQTGASVKTILEEAGIGIRSGCRGNGACGLCQVRVEAGVVNSPEPNEQLALPAERLNSGIRLACRLIPENDLTIRIPDNAPGNRWRCLAPDYLPCTPSSLGHPSTKQSVPDAYGLAIDMGTTHICLTIWDLYRNQRLAGRIGLNPQFQYGSDVVTRLMAAAESAETARQSAARPLQAINEAVNYICSQNGLNPENILRVVVVGNTAMLMLLSQTDPVPLLQPSNWTQPVHCRSIDSAKWAEALGINPQATIEIIPPLAGFVGSDLLAGVLATEMLEYPGSLLIDFGTNSEIALWDGEKLRVTSAAGGPAFEGSGIKCGQPAGPGAIYAVEVVPGLSHFKFHIIDGDGNQPRGFCGSGLVHLIACLRRAGHLSATGQPEHVFSGAEFPQFNEHTTLRPGKGDIDLFQRAKAAIGVGVKVLLSESGMSPGDLNRVYVCGAFGRQLNISNAKSIGLLPDIANDRITLCGNTSLAGCEQLLVLPEKTSKLAALLQNTSITNLSNVPDFDELFLENLYLSPQRRDAV